MGSCNITSCRGLEAVHPGCHERSSKQRLGLLMEDRFQVIAQVMDGGDAVTGRVLSVRQLHWSIFRRAAKLRT